MRSFSRVTFGTIAAALMIFTPQLGHAQSCTPLETVLGQANAADLPVEQFTGADTGRAVTFFNRIPPLSDETFDLALIIALPDGSGVLAVGRGGAVCGQVHLPEDGLRIMTTFVKGISI